MSTAVWPPLEPDELEKRVQESLKNELQWLLSSLQDTLRSLKEGLEECASLLAPSETSSTLVLSSHRSESLKGYVTRVGTRIVKGDIKLRLPSLPPPRGSPAYPLTISMLPEAPVLHLEQLASARTLINACLDVVDACSWAGDPTNAQFISGQLRLLDVNMQEAKKALKGDGDAQPPWWQNPVDEKTFDPPLPPTLSFHLTIRDAALLLELRTLEPLAPHAPGSNGSSASTNPSGGAGTDTSSTAGSAASFLSNPLSLSSLPNRLAVALGAARPHPPPPHDEAGDTFRFRGLDVRVRDRVRVESQDPQLMAALAKIAALERAVAVARRALAVAMGVDEE